LAFAGHSRDVSISTPSTIHRNRIPVIMAAASATRHKMKLAELTDKTYQYNNCAYLNPQDLVALGMTAGDKILIDEQQVFRTKADPEQKPGDLGTSPLVWTALHLKTKKEALGNVVMVERWDDAARSTPIAHTISLVVDTYTKAPTHLDVAQFDDYVRRRLGAETFCKDQRWIIKYAMSNNTYWLSLRVVDLREATPEQMEHKEDGAKKRRRARQKSIKFGIMDAGGATVLSLVAANNPFMKLIHPKGTLGAGGVAFNYDAEQMGIGGLDDQFAVIFRRAFASRLFPPELVAKLGIKHIKGMLLYGPPGTGKTLIARSIGGMLTENEPKVINGPEVLNKYVGQSEENVRKLFADAIAEQEAKGDDSSLHIIIFDEIDAICKQRGSSGGSTGVGDTVVNQLLSMIDGVHALNNVLIIGMTNRMDLLDDALLRSGRLEVHIEIGLPDQDGREQIFRIHTKALRENGFLDESISISELAKRTKNYTGAEIEGVVRSAVSFAMQTHIDVDDIGKIDAKKLQNIRITQQFFDLALEEVMPELGKKKVDEQLSFMYSRGIVDFNAQIVEIKDCVRKLLATMGRAQSSSMNRQALLLRGDGGSGKSAMAAFLANEVARWPFIRVVSADNFVGAADIAVCSAIDKIFSDGYKSKQSIIILDDIERLIGYTMGPRFSNAVLQAILTLIRRVNTTDAERKVFVIATCTHRVARELDLDRKFDFVRNLPSVRTASEFETVITDSGHGKMCTPNVHEIVKEFPESKAGGVGISDLLTVLELAEDGEQRITVDSFRSAWKSKFIARGDDGLDLDLE